MNRRDFVKTTAAFGLATTAAEASLLAGFYVPGEEVAHEFTLMQWPVSRKVYRDAGFLEDVQNTIARIANAISEFEPVVMLADKSQHSNARRMLSATVELWDVPTDDLWCRDSGPITTINGKGARAVSHIQFNGWGGKQTHKNDGLIASRMAEILEFDLFDTGLKGEAGGVEQDGHGLLLAHESSWVIQNRNKGQNRAEVEARLLTAYGADRMIWAPGVKGQDITDYHIDSLVRLTGENRALINLPEDPDLTDPFHRSALETFDIIKEAGLKLDVIPEPNFRRVKDYDFVASYANYYICNGAVIMAEFGDKTTDEIARKAMARHFPNREIVTMNVDALGELGGGIHCATHEVPEA